MMGESFQFYSAEADFVIIRIYTQICNNLRLGKYNLAIIALSPTHVKCTYSGWFR